MRHCQVPGCTGTVSRWGTLCSTHKTRQRRHGHPLQQGVTKTELVPYEAVIRLRKARNPDSPLWTSITARWYGLVDHCRGVIAIAKDGRAMNRHDRRACEEIVKLAENVEPDALVETALSLYLMQDQSPRRFMSDDAFRHQLARRLRALTDVNAGTWFDGKTGKMKRVYRDLPASTTLTMGAMLAETFGVAGLLLAQREAQDAEKKRRENEELAQAVKDLQ